MTSDPTQDDRRPYPAPTVSVSATAERAVLPDTVELHATAAARAATERDVTEALVQAAAALERVALPADVRAHPGAISRWQDGGPDADWHAERTTVFTGPAAAAGGLLAALDSVPDLALDGPHWSVGRDSPAHAALQADSVHEARARAQRYADALGGTLGPLVELSDRDFAGGRGTVRMAMAAEYGSRGGLAELDPRPYPVEISATVHARWLLVLPD